MPCTKERYPATFTQEEIELLEAEVKLAVAKAEVRAAQQGYYRGSAQSNQMKKKAEKDTIDIAHDRHFFRLVKDGVMSEEDAKERPVHSHG